MSALTLCHRGDVVLLRAADRTSYIAGQIWLLLETYGENIALVSCWPFIKYDPNACAAEWHEKQNPELVELSDIVDTLVYTRCRANVIRTLVPWRLRHVFGG